jgi:hypothetical protein
MLDAPEVPDGPPTSPTEVPVVHRRDLDLAPGRVGEL